MSTSTAAIVSVPWSYRVARSTPGKSLSIGSIDMDYFPMGQSSVNINMPITLLISLLDLIIKET